MACANALKPGKSGALAIVPGKTEKSSLVQRIYTKVAADLMPPPESHKTLATAQKEMLRDQPGSHRHGGQTHR